jgi:hypothetical protein
MAITATARFEDGPCKGTSRRITFDQQPPEFLNCGGSRYIISTVPAVSFIPYVVQGGTLDSGTAVRAADRDMLRAWTRLHTVLNRGVGRQVARVETARRRIRRAVK